MENQTDLLQPHFNIHRGMMVMLVVIFVYLRRFHLPSSRGTQSRIVRAERRIISCSTEIYRGHQNNRYILGCIAGEISTIVGTLMEIESCRMHGQVSQGSLYWIGNHLMDVHGPEGD